MSGAIGALRNSFENFTMTLCDQALAERTADGVQAIDFFTKGLIYYALHSCDNWQKV